MVDLGDYEQLRYQMAGTDKAKLDKLYGKNAMETKNKKNLKNMERLKTLTLQDKNKNPTTHAKSHNRSQKIRQLQEDLQTEEPKKDEADTY